jgi:preprotein translocase subunit SecD
MHLKGSKELFCVSSQIIADSSNILSVTVGPVFGTQPLLTILLDDAGAAKMKTVSTANVGNRIAVILDGEMIEAPVVREPLSDVLRMNLYMTDAEMEAFAVTLTSFRRVQ